MSGSLRRWADEQQFVAEPMHVNRDEQGNIVPTVTLTWITPDPLGANAAMGRMYKGIPTYSLDQITDEERKQYYLDSIATHLQAPLEAIKMHFFLEGVTRSFTHQMVRQRTAVYAQESLRFAVKEHFAENECSMPPSIAALPKKAPLRQEYEEFNKGVEKFYNFMVSNGIPAEDARGCLPHWITTRLNYVTDLRNLSMHAGNRLCTQAQFEWRVVFLGIVKAIREYRPDFSWMGGADSGFGTGQRTALIAEWEAKYRWQFEMIADSALFRPVCYQLGRCPFKASFDRDCKIRGRVDTFASYGVPSAQWGETDEVAGISAINPAEWLLDPSAARRTGGAGHE